MSDERKKFTLYLHPDKRSDQQALTVIESVPRSARGDLYRNVFIAGLALQQLDDRLPALLTTFLDGQMTADQLVGLDRQHNRMEAFSGRHTGCHT